MRLLILGPYPLPGETLAGGAMAAVYDLARGMAKRGITVHVASAHLGISPHSAQDGPITVHHLPVIAGHRLRWQRPMRNALKNVINHVRPHILHAHGTSFYAAAALDAGLPAVLTIHGITYREAQRSGDHDLKKRAVWWYNALFEQWIMRRARHCIAISPYVQQAFARFRNIHWHNIPNPIADICFELPSQPQSGRLLLPGRVIPRKAIDIAIRGFAEVAAAYPEARLIIAGETTTHPAYVAHCRNLATDLGVGDRIHMLGALSREALLAEYQQAAAVLLPSRQETAPIVIAEALAFGCPVIASAVGGVPAMIEHGVSGLLIPPEDAPALGAALHQLLSQPENTERWRNNARQAATVYKLDHVISATLAVYDQIR